MFYWCSELFCLAALGMNCLPVFAQDASQAAVLPNNPGALMLQAAKSNGLISADMPAWHLKASFKLLDEQGNVKDQGTYEEFFVSPAKYKCSFTGLAFSRTDYGTEKGVLRSGTRQPPPNLITDIRREFVNPLPSPVAIEHQTYQMWKREIDGEMLACFMVTGLPMNPSLSYCLALDKPFLRSTSSTSESLQVLHRQVTLFQDRFVPSDLEILQSGKPALTAHLETLEVLNPIDEIDFAPSPDATLLHRRINISAGVVVGLLKENSAPLYPPEAKAAGISGTVVLRAVIGVKGRVTELQIVSGPVALQQAAMDAVRQWQYRPYLLNGEPIEVNTQINVVFTLSR
jgi:protein TonB